MAAAHLLLGTNTMVGGFRLLELYRGPEPRVVEARDPGAGADEAPVELLLAQTSLERVALKPLLDRLAPAWLSFRHPAARPVRSVQVFAVPVDRPGIGEAELVAAVGSRVEGARLPSLLKAQGSLPAASALRIAVQVAHAVTAALAHGVGSTGLSPELVRVSGVLGGGGEVVRVGFLGAAGFAASWGPAEETLEDTEVGRLGRLMELMARHVQPELGVEEELAELGARCLGRGREAPHAHPLEVELRLRVLERRLPRVVPAEGPEPPAGWVLDRMIDISDEDVFDESATRLRLLPA